MRAGQIRKAKNTNLIISKGDEGKGSERFGNEHICDFTVLHKKLSKLIGCHVLGATAHKNFPASHRLIRASLFQEILDHLIENRVYSCNVHNGKGITKHLKCEMCICSNLKP